MTASLPPPLDFESHYEVKPQEEEYQLITIHQKPSIDRMDQIDLTPTQTPDNDHVYSNLQEEIPITPEPNRDYDNPDILTLPVIQPTNPGDYDDPNIVLQASLSKRTVEGWVIQ